MIDIKPFAPKIIERSINKKTVFNSFSDYLSFREFYVTAETPSVFCIHCRNTFFSIKSAESSTCYKYKSSLDTTVKRGDGESLYDYIKRRYKTVKVVQEHFFEYAAKVTNELGDDLALYEKGNTKSCSKSSLRSFDSWMNSNSSPDNRGILLLNRESYFYSKRFKHYPLHYTTHYGYRKPKCLGVLKQFAKDDTENKDMFSRSSKSQIRTAWDDLFAHRERSWKVKKVKKQWMINLG